MDTMTRQTIHCRAPGKVNLTLAILGRREDGFHELESWVAPIDWCDRLQFCQADALSLRLEGEDQGVPSGPDNLVWRAAEALARTAGREPNVAITLKKAIPVGTGLGGGSSDAAATLLGLNRLWELGWSAEQLLPVAEALGSDVPLFLTGHSAIVRGRGERIEPMHAAWHGWLVLVVPPFRLSTTVVYQEWSNAAPTARASARPWTALPCPSASLLDRLFNDLEPAAFRVEPKLASLHAAIDGLQGRPVRMTGSGTALFTLFDDRTEAETWRSAAAALLPAGALLRVISTSPPKHSVDNANAPVRHH